MNYTRREAIVLTAAGMTGAMLSSRGAEPSGNPSTMPCRVLGRTGVDVPLVGFGCGTRFFSTYTPASGLDALELAFSLGIRYIDTANSYGDGKSEAMVAPFVQKHRKDLFLVTKLKERTADGALRQLEQSFKRLGVDSVDLLHVHRVDDDADLAKIEAGDGVLKAFYKLREQKVARFLGITAHADPEPLRKAIERNDFDCVQMPLNAALSGVSLAGFKPPHPGERTYCFESVVLPVALRKRMGVLAMKVFAQGKLVGRDPTKADPASLLRYAWSLPISAAIVGMHTPDIIRQNVALAKAFAPMSSEEMHALAARLAPTNKVVLDRFFHNHSDFV